MPIMERFKYIQYYISIQMTILNSEIHNAWKFNCGALLVDTLAWKEKYIRKIRDTYPSISRHDLTMKVKQAKYKKFKDRAYFLLSTHPSVIATTQVEDGLQ